MSRVTGKSRQALFRVFFNRKHTLDSQYFGLNCSLLNNSVSFSFSNAFHSKMFTSLTKVLKFLVMNIFWSEHEKWTS